MRLSVFTMSGRKQWATVKKYSAVCEGTHSDKLVKQHHWLLSENKKKDGATLGNAKAQVIGPLETQSNLKKQMLMYIPQ